MSDIVERLRANAVAGYPDEMMLEAADTITTLRGEVERLRAALESIAKNTCCEGCGEAALVARAALQETKNAD